MLLSIRLQCWTLYRVINAIKDQSEKYMHVMVYGEFVTKPSLELAKLLAKSLLIALTVHTLLIQVQALEEGSMKLERFTGRKKLLLQKMHIMEALWVLLLMSLEERKKPFAPLIPEVDFINYNSFEDIDKIDNQLHVVLETIQGSAGFILVKTDI